MNAVSILKMLVHLNFIIELSFSWDLHDWYLSNIHDNPNWIQLLAGEAQTLLWLPDSVLVSNLCPPSLSV